MPAIFESTWVVMVTVRQWGGVSMGWVGPAETPRSDKKAFCEERRSVRRYVLRVGKKRKQYVLKRKRYVLR